ncbi:MAG: ABC transporter permease [Bacteroidales bacterium]|nr:ABC transporter permease [Bacteroidales bacterium]MCM1414365.1 ABC transporter permease [bacterium]MCM1424923.1 ABC transporter permease [bacterium]
MELFKLEHKKLWQKNSTKILVLLCFVYCVLFASILVYQWMGFGSYSDRNGNKNFDGYENVRRCQEYVRKYGELTDERLQDWVRDYQALTVELEEQKKATGQEDPETVQTEGASDQFVVNNWLSWLYPELERTDIWKLMSCYVEPEKLTGFYERRQQAIETFLSASGQTGEEREYLLRINEKVQTPFSPWRWSDGWSNVLGSALADLGVVLALFLAVVLSSLFAGEWHDNTGQLLLTTKNGWKPLARAKILTGLSFTLELFVMQAAGMIGTQLIYLGTEGWDMPIQMIKMIAIAPMNMLQAEIYEVVFTLLGALGYAGLVMLISAWCKSQIPALLVSLAFVYGPGIIDRYLPVWMAKLFDFLPLVGSSSDIFRTTTYHLFGHYIWSPYLLTWAPALIGILCLPPAVRGWTRRMRV